MNEEQVRYAYFFFGMFLSILPMAGYLGMIVVFASFFMTYDRLNNPFIAFSSIAFLAFSGFIKSRFK